MVLGMHPAIGPNADLDQWFAAEILPYEAALTRYIRKVWSDPADVADLRQDIYIRVYENALKARPQTPRFFLFRIARNLLSDRIRHGRIISIDYTHDMDALNVLVDEVSPEQRVSARQQLGRVLQCVDALPERSREVIWMRRVQGLSQREAAERLGIMEKTLAGYLSRGLDMLTRYVLADEPRETTTDEVGDRSHEIRHG